MSQPCGIRTVRAGQMTRFRVFPPQRVFPANPGWLGCPNRSKIPRRRNPASLRVANPGRLSASSGRGSCQADTRMMRSICWGFRRPNYPEAATRRTWRVRCHPVSMRTCLVQLSLEACPTAVDRHLFPVDELVSSSMRNMMARAMSSESPIMLLPLASKPSDTPPRTL